MTVAEAIQIATGQLIQAEVETPRLDAQLLLTWTLKCRREDLAREPERVLSDRDQLIYEKAVLLRALRRPLPYITGEQWFYGRPFKINRAVLIPRPETELLAQTTLERSHGISAPCFADIGVGSGALAVTLACERADCHVCGTDLSGDALKMARKNIARYSVQERVTVLQGDLLAPLPSLSCFDIIVSNPPYITEAELADLQPEVRDYEPGLALSGMPGATGPDGAALHRRLLNESANYLKPAGLLMMEVGQGQAKAVTDYAARHGWRDVAVLADLAGIERVVVATRPS